MSQIREKSGIYVYHQARCGQCEWICTDRRSHESEAWGDLQAHLRSYHGGNVKELRVKRTVTEEVLPPREEDPDEVIPMPLVDPELVQEKK